MNDRFSNIKNLCSRDAESKAWANRQLKYGIRLLQGDPSCGGSSDFDSNLVLAISLKQTLSFEGWTWQTERLDNWINRARAKKDFLPGKYHPKPPLRPLKEVDSSEKEEEGSKNRLSLADFLGGS